MKRMVEGEQPLAFAVGGCRAGFFRGKCGRSGLNQMPFSVPCSIQWVNGAPWTGGRKVFVDPVREKGRHAQIQFAP